MARYSESGIDFLIEPLLPAIGKACEVGANDGFSDSITLRFEERGWDVLCVEPNPMLKGDRNKWVSVACGEADLDNQPFWVVGNKPWPSDSARPENGELRNKTLPGAPYLPFQVNVRRLDRVLEEAGFDSLDLLVVDTEGWEPEVFAGFSLERWKPKVIVVEEFLPRRHELPGYIPLEKKRWDAIYVRS